LVDRFHVPQMLLQGGGDGLGQHRHPVFVAFALADGDFPSLEIQVFHPEPKAFEQTQAAGRTALLGDFCHGRSPDRILQPALTLSVLGRCNKRHAEIAASPCFVTR